ncbi:hypothetical protein [Arthrobacter rhombi]|uniref:hypothetical protein n=1 Tax=Arthrobacter rhombi TaxID=71253 RepID=UPI003FD0F476
MLFTGGGLASPDALLSAMSLLAGGLIAAFALLASWRDRLTDRADSFSTSERLERDHLDETAAHLLVAAYGSAISAVLLVIGMNFSQGQGGELTGPIAALAAAAATFVVLVFLIALPRLYSSYVQLNGVRKELSGLHSGTRHKP